MKIFLEKFESAIDYRIVSRGEDYFREGAVRNLKKIKEDEWIASVEGSENYKVSVCLKNSQVQDHSCSCPYDMGPVCKHIVAMLFAIREKQDGTSASAEEPGPLSRKIKKIKQEKTLEEILSDMPRAKLNATLIKYASQDSDFASHIFDQENPRTVRGSSNKERYRRIIQSAVDAVRHRHGHIGYWQASDAVRGAERVLDMAQGFLEQKQSAWAFPVYQCVLEEMVPLLQEADDSNGCIGDVIGSAFQGLSDCAKEAKTEPFSKKLFDYLLRECEHSRYEGWSDWRWEFLEIAGQMVESPEEREKLFAQIGTLQKSEDHKEHSWSSRYDEEKALVIKLSVMERLGAKEEVEEFLNQHLDCTPFRERAIDRALRRRNYELAKKLAVEGIELDKKQGFPGLVNRWTEKLLETAHREKDSEAVKKYSLLLFMDTGDFKFYRQYKDCFSKQDWGQEIENIITSIKQSRNGRIVVTLPEIFIQEKRWDDLMEHVRQSNSSYTLEQYEKYLVPRFSDQLIPIYESVIVKKLAPQMGRANYQYLCQFLRRMQKLGAKERVKTLIESLSEKYRNRPALREELNRV